MIPELFHRGELGKRDIYVRLEWVHESLQHASDYESFAVSISKLYDVLKLNNGRYIMEVEEVEKLVKDIYEDKYFTFLPYKEILIAIKLENMALTISVQKQYDILWDEVEEGVIYIFDRRALDEIFETI